MELGKLQTTDAERAGLWFTFPGSDLKVKIASANSEAYQKCLRQKYQAKRRDLGGLELDDDTEESLTIEALSEHILLGWENLTEQGAPVGFSKSKALDLLRNAPKLRAFVVRTATRQSAFEEAEAKAQEANLGNS